MSELKRGDRVILTDEAQRSFPAMVSKGSHVGEIVRISSSKRLRIQRDGVKNADYWGAGLWKKEPSRDDFTIDLRGANERIADLEREREADRAAICWLKSIAEGALGRKLHMGDYGAKPFAASIQRATEARG